jgi:hypothetical protein
LATLTEESKFNITSVIGGSGNIYDHTLNFLSMRDGGCLYKLMEQATVINYSPNLIIHNKKVGKCAM